jgi:hypothetical protein
MPDEDAAAIDDLSDDCEPTIAGILNCLRMLVDEATELRLDGTVTALQRALQVCLAETDSGLPETEAGTPPLPAGTLLH